MQRLAEFLIASLDLVRAQADTIGETTKATARATVVTFLWGLFALVGGLLLLAALTVALAPALGVAGALALTGVLTCASAALAWRFLG